MVGKPVRPSKIRVSAALRPRDVPVGLRQHPDRERDHHHPDGRACPALEVPDGLHALGHDQHLDGPQSQEPHPADQVKPEQAGLGQSLEAWEEMQRRRTFSAMEARKVWMPYQAIATAPRTSAGKLAPQMPHDIRETTGYGAPVSWPVKPDMHQPPKMISAPPRMRSVTWIGLRPEEEQAGREGVAAGVVRCPSSTARTGCRSPLALVRLGGLEVLVVETRANPDPELRGQRGPKCWVGMVVLRFVRVDIRCGYSVIGANR